MAAGSAVEASREGAGSLLRRAAHRRHDCQHDQPDQQEHACHDRRRLSGIELIDRDERLIGCDQAEHRGGDEQHHRDGDDGGLPERALERFLDPSADLQVDSSAIAVRSIEVLPLAPGEDAEQEAEADGDGDRRSGFCRIASSAWLAASTALSWARFICLLAMRETVEVRLWMSARIASIWPANSCASGLLGDYR